MTIIHFNELKNREDWLKHREGKIGGSDAACILGMNPYKSNQQLWEEKTGKRESEDISDKPYVQYGHSAEPLLRELFKLDFPEYKVDYYDNNMITNDKYPFAHASLDGWLSDQRGRKGIWECKTTEIMNRHMGAKWENSIPDNYYIQVLHYLMVTEFDFAVVKAQLKYNIDGEVFLKTRHYFIEREDVEEDIKILAQKEFEFYKHIKDGTKPALILPSI